MVVVVVVLGCECKRFSSHLKGIIKLDGEGTALFSLSTSNQPTSQREDAHILLTQPDVDPQKQQRSKNLSAFEGHT